MKKQETKRVLFSPVPQGRESSPFGWRGSSFHMGKDITPTHDPSVVAVAEGIVVAVVNNCTEGYPQCGGGYGNYITLDHQNGYFTRYAHLSSVSPSVQAGKVLKRGHFLGKVGNTGHSFGAHLHFEVLTENTFYSTKPSAFLNPDDFLTGAKTFPPPRTKRKGIFTMLLTILGIAGFGFLMFWFYLRRKIYKAPATPMEPPPTIQDMGNINT